MDLTRHLSGEDARWRRVWAATEGAELRLWRKRKVRRRLVRMPDKRGFVLVRNGPKIGEMIARVVEHVGNELGLLDRAVDGSVVGAMRSNYWA